MYLKSVKFAENLYSTHKERVRYIILYYWMKSYFVPLIIYDRFLIVIEKNQYCHLPINLVFWWRI